MFFFSASRTGGTIPKDNDMPPTADRLCLLFPSRLLALLYTNWSFAPQLPSLNSNRESQQASKQARNKPCLPKVGIPADT